MTNIYDIYERQIIIIYINLTTSNIPSGKDIYNSQ